MCQEIGKRTYPPVANIVSLITQISDLKWKKNHLGEKEIILLNFRSNNSKTKIKVCNSCPITMLSYNEMQLTRKKDILKPS